LLSISYQWWHDPSALRIRYEDLVGDPKGEFAAIAKAFDGPPDTLEPILQEMNFETFRAMPNRHGWQGRPGLWRKLIPTVTALKIYAYHHCVFNALDYPIPLWLTTHANAKRDWERLIV
jgi:hypothetical protein